MNTTPAATPETTTVTAEIVTTETITAAIVTDETVTDIETTDTAGATSTTAPVASSLDLAPASPVLHEPPLQSTFAQPTQPAYSTQTAPAYGYPVYGHPEAGAVATLQAPAPAGTDWNAGGRQVTESECAWGVAAHLSGFVAAWFALGFLGPLTVWLLGGRDSRFVREHSVEALNFNLSILLYAAVSAVLMLALVGFVLLPLVGLLYLVASIQGARAASAGRDFRYPLTLRFIK